MSVTTIRAQRQARGNSELASARPIAPLSGWLFTAMES